MYDNTKLEEELKKHFEISENPFEMTSQYELVSFEALRNFVRDYADECYRIGKDSSECGCECPL